MPHWPQTKLKEKEHSREIIKKGKIHIYIYIKQRRVTPLHLKNFYSQAKLIGDLTKI